MPAAVFGVGPIELLMLLGIGGICVAVPVAIIVLLVMLLRNKNQSRE